MNTQPNHAARVVAGAAIGVGFAYLVLTENGRRILNSIEPWLDGVINDMQRLRAAAAKARTALDGGRESLHAVRGLSSFSREPQESGVADFRH